VIFVDDTGLIFSYRWCWRQSEASAAQPDTTEAIITVEAQHEGGRAAVEAALADLLALLKEYAGGTYTSSVLDATYPILADQVNIL
jgi:DNA/RNA-binding domain of Phe-tRNA-synthetase-like protein